MVSFEIDRVVGSWQLAVGLAWLGLAWLDLLYLLSTVLDQREYQVVVDDEGSEL
jgi:hypothetical protein